MELIKDSRATGGGILHFDSPEFPVAVCEALLKQVTVKNVSEVRHRDGTLLE